MKALISLGIYLLHELKGHPSDQYIPIHRSLTIKSRTYLFKINSPLQFWHMLPQNQQVVMPFCRQ